ncbi:helix-turn-helix domain-containing protein [Roseibium denhamense]|uniref:Helix-turn-helix n=1 Tax=Roseibium denhamense TaxID=76305 RepID=A0ABY1P3M0_9HYPH|nr:helix-turn-helix domain-containing protein [Roseibium denhamense]MTI05205.1 helix-turn-helix domain-containing protein [Roseibium denhamense]SMP25736.1 Helix-turn-helix [Roseibium denhamense]
MDKRIRSALFRQRLLDALETQSVSRSALARRCSVDRSTIAQILAEDDGRVPNAHLAAECAAALGVSVDWLLGLTERRETTAELLETSFRLAEAEKTIADTRLEEWLTEAAGYKIRYVPTSIPDILKTDAVLDYEYSSFLDKTPAQAGSAVQDQEKWLSRPGSDYEICCSLEQVQNLARGEGYWRELSSAARKEQLEAMATRCDALYPALRLYFFDPKVVYSAPVTIFGPLLAIVYLGQQYLVFREKRQVEALTRHFDQLIRDCGVDARSSAAMLAEMAENCAS